MGDQTRIQRWEAGLLKQPRIIPEHELHICLMRQTRRTIYRGGYLQFENLAYRGDALAEHAGENIVLRYDPRNITQVLVYRHEPDREVYLGVAQAIDFEGEVLTLDDAKAHSRCIREDGKAVSNDTMLDEMRDREAFIGQKQKSRKDRQKDAQAALRPATPPILGPDSSDLTSADVQPDESPEDLEIPEFDIWDFDDDDV